MAPRLEFAAVLLAFDQVGAVDSFVRQIIGSVRVVVTISQPLALANAHVAEHLAFANILVRT